MPSKTPAKAPASSTPATQATPEVNDFGSNAASAGAIEQGTAQEPSVLETAMAGSDYQVVSGDTLGDIAEQAYGQVEAYWDIFHANDLIEDPDHIEVGWVLELPCAVGSTCGEEEVTGASDSPAAEGTLTYASTAVKLTAVGEKTLREIMTESEVSALTINSTRRSPSEQARVMYNNLEEHGAAHQKRLYAKSGQEVIAVYETLQGEGKDETAIRKAMEDKIRELGPPNVSTHCTLKTADIDPGSLGDKQSAFITKARAHTNVRKVIPPPTDPAVHVEMKSM